MTTNAGYSIRKCEEYVVRSTCHKKGDELSLKKENAQLHILLQSRVTGSPDGSFYEPATRFYNQLSGLPSKRLTKAHPGDRVRMQSSRVHASTSLVINK